MVLPFHQNEITRHKRMGRIDCSIHPKFIGINGVRTGESVAESVSALVAATGKNLAAVSGSHSLSEAMNFLAMELLGLIGARSSHFVLPPEKILPAEPFGPCTYSTAGGENSPRTAVDKNSAVLMRHTGSIISVLPHSVNQKCKNWCMFPFPAKPCGAYRNMQLSLVSFCLFFRAFALQKTAFYI